MKSLLLALFAIPALAAEPSGQPGIAHSEFIFETAPFPSCHASTIVETSDGLVAAWFGGTKEGAPDVGIWLSRQLHGQWTAPVEVANGVRADGQRFACFNPVLFQPKTGPLLLFYKAGGQPNGWAGFLKTSTDHGATWSAASPLPEGFVGPVKNKPVQLADGSLLCGSSIETAGKWRVQFERSADLGKTWTKTEFLNDGVKIGAIQPSILFPGGNQLLAIGRTKQSRLFRIASEDGGKTWGEMTLTDLPNPNSGTDAVTLRDGRHLLVYNHTEKGRSPLNVAVSTDGRSWQAALVLESEPGEYSYPAVIQTADGLVHAVYTWKRQRIKHVIIDPAKLVLAPIQDGKWPETPKAAVSAPAAGKSAPAPELTIVNRVRYYPAKDRSAAMVGGKITGSNVSDSTGFQTLAEIATTPAQNEWSELRFPNAKPYRWVRYEAPPGSHGNLAELEFYAGERKVTGTGFGSPGGYWHAAFDQKLETWSNSPTADSQVAGFDLGEQAATARPGVTPAGGNFEQAQHVTMQCPTPGAAIRYTLDGTTPDTETGQLYTAPLTIEKNATLVSVAFKEGLAPSPPRITTLWVGPAVHPPMNSFHVGNSLTGNASRFATFLRTAGGTDAFPAYLIGGSLSVRLWNDAHGTDQKRWDETYAKAVHPLDYFTLQPRDFNVAEEVDYATRFIQLIREKSPNVQPWLYAEWVEKDRQRPTDKGLVPSYEMKKTFPALTWEESMSAMVLYNEEVQHGIFARDHEGKRVRIIPTALAMGWARNWIDHGKLPGIPPGEASFYQTLFADQVHVNDAGCYLVALTWYAALYRESPENRLLPIGTTLTSAQATALQRLAWDVIKNYPDCGLYEEGTEPCGAPQFLPQEKRADGVASLALSSTTPGAWFRYTLDGTTPTRTNGYIYCGVISVPPGAAVKAVAYRSGMADSPVASAPSSL